MAFVNKDNPCPECGYPNGPSCELCRGAIFAGERLAGKGLCKNKKRGPKPRPDNHKMETMRVPLCMHEEVKVMIKEWKKGLGYA